MASRLDKAKRAAEDFSDRVGCEYKEAEAKTDSLLAKVRRAMGVVEDSKYSTLILWVPGILTFLPCTWMIFHELWDSTKVGAIILAPVFGALLGCMGALVGACFWTVISEGWTERD